MFVRTPPKVKVKKSFFGGKKKEAKPKAAVGHAPAPESDSNRKGDQEDEDSEAEETGKILVVHVLFGEDLVAMDKSGADNTGRGGGGEREKASSCPCAARTLLDSACCVYPPQRRGVPHTSRAPQFGPPAFPCACLSATTRRPTSPTHTPPLRPHAHTGFSDPFVAFKCGSKKEYKCERQETTLNPEWMEEVVLPYPSSEPCLGPHWGCCAALPPGCHPATGLPIAAQGRRWSWCPTT